MNKKIVKKITIGFTVGAVGVVGLVVLVLKLTKTQTLITPVSRGAAPMSGDTVTDADLQAGKTYQYSISPSQIDQWSPVLDVKVDEYSTLCGTVGKKNLNGVCV